MSEWYYTYFRVSLLDFCKTPFWSDDPATMYALIVGNKTVAMPPSLGREAKDLLMKLLTRDPAKRISGEEMVRHPFYAGIDWDKVIRMEYIPPYVPPLVHHKP